MSRRRLRWDPRGWMRAVMKPHRQIALLGLLVAIVIGATVSPMISASEATYQDLRFLNDRLVPARRALVRVDKALEAEIGKANAYFLQGPAAARDARLVDASSAFEVTRNAWLSYVNRRVPTPGITRDEARYESADRSTVATSTAAFADSTLGASLTAQRAVMLALDTQHNALVLVQRDYEVIIDRIIGARHDETQAYHSALPTEVAVAAVLLLLAFGSVWLTNRSGDKRRVLRDAERAEEVTRNDLETRLQRSLQMAPTEDTCYAVVGDALREAKLGVRVDFAVVDSNNALWVQAATTRDGDGAERFACPSDPTTCPAAVRGQTLTFTSSRVHLGICPYLVGRPAGDLSAVCVPVGIGGKSAGVLHAMGPDGEAPSLGSIETLELISRKTGERIAMLRALALSETEAKTDPLTGLMNRRSLESAVQRLANNGRRYVIAYGDLDHFKLLNDVHGHDTGDRALRLFAGVLGDCVRPGDFVARYGGEEFVIMLPECTRSDAVAVLERVRDQLEVAVHNESAPSFTVSFGVAASAFDRTFGETLEIADQALLRAKAEGRNRIVVSEMVEADGPAL